MSVFEKRDYVDGPNGDDVDAALMEDIERRIDEALDDVVIVSQPNTFTAKQTMSGGLALTATLGGWKGQNVSGLPNVVLTSQDNPQVNALQLGIDAPAAEIKEQHFTTQRPTDQGVGGRLVMNPGASFGTNQPGAAVYIADGLSTGSASGQGIGFQLSRAGSAGTTTNARTDAFAMVDVSGFSAFYPASANNGFLGLASNPWYYAYVANLYVTGGAGFWGKTPPVSKPAAPTTLAEVISVLQSYGLTA